MLARDDLDAVARSPVPVGLVGVQSAALRALSPVFLVSRVLGLAPLRLRQAAPRREASATASRTWAAHSAVCVAATLGGMAWAGLRLAAKSREPAMLSTVLVVSFALKQAASASIAVCSVAKGAAVARALEKLVRISSRSSPTLADEPEPPGLARRLASLRRAAVAQTVFLAAGWAAVGVLVALDLPPAFNEVAAFPALFLVNVQFTDVVLLLRAELEALNDSLERRFQQRGQRGAVSWIGKDFAKDDAGFVSTARALQRELRRGFHLLDEAYGLQTLLFLAVAFVQTTVVLYMLVVEGALLWVPVASTLVMLGQLYAMVAACQGAKDESRRTAVAVHAALLRSGLGADTRAELVDFSVQLLASETAFTACGFFAIDLALLQSFVGTVLTYIVIMVQFRG